MHKDLQTYTHMHRWRRHAFAWLAALLLPFAFATGAHARDPQVWVNTNSGVYHCPGGQYYGTTKRGKYFDESEAVAHGYRAAYHKPCSPAVAQRTREQIIDRLSPGPTGDTTTVGSTPAPASTTAPSTRYYGATKRGRYASEAEAIAAGNRAAYGQRCR